VVVAFQLSDYFTRDRILFVLNSLFWIGWMFALWDMFETILTAGDTPYRLHHGWIGLVLVAVVWLITMVYVMRNKE
jgi:hypothetical protein